MRGIEKEIQQKRPFRNEQERAMVNLLYTSNWLNDQLKSYFKPFGITPTQYNILRILNGAEKAMTTNEIRKRMIHKMSDITRLIDRLIKKEFVHKKVHGADKRLVDIVITERGKELLNNIGSNHLPLGHFMKAISEEESLLLNQTLDKLREKF